MALILATATLLLVDLLDRTVASANHNWRVTLSVASRTAEAGESIRVVAEANNPIASSPYYLYIEVDGTDVKRCNTTRCETYVAYPSAGTHRVRAYIYGTTDDQYCYYSSSSSSSSSSSGYCVDVPSGLIAESQTFELSWTSVSVDWIVQLSGPVADLRVGESAQLTANVNQPLDTTPYYLIIQDATTFEVLNSCGNGQSCDATARRDVPTEATFIAYLSESLEGGDGLNFSDSLTVTWTETEVSPRSELTAAPNEDLPTFKAQGAGTTGPSFWLVFAILLFGTVVVGGLLYWAFRLSPR